MTRRTSRKVTTDALLTRVVTLLTDKKVLVVIVTLASFLLYWRTAAPTVLPGDSGELQFAPWGFWLAHPTGYPLYLILGGIWQHLIPIGDPAFRMNLFSAFWSALAVGISFLVFWRVTRNNLASAIAALGLAVTPLFWSQATRAEVYALNTFFLALLTLLGVLWHETGKRKYAIAFALTFGLSLTHHRTTILLVPAFAALLIDKLWVAPFDPRAFAKRAWVYVLLAAIPLLLYLYIPLRTGATPYAMLNLAPAPPIVIFENSLRGWLGVILGSGFSAELGFTDATWAALREFPGQWLEQVNPFGLLLTLFGFGALVWQRKFAIAAYLLTGFLTLVGFNSLYHIGDIADYYTPLYFLSMIAAAAGIAVLVQLAQKFTLAQIGMLPNIVLLACFAALPVQNLFNNFFIQDKSTQVNTRAHWSRILEDGLPDNSILLSNDRDEMTPLYYLQLVEKQKPNWSGIFPRIASGAQYDNVISLVQRVAASNRPIYAIKPIAALTLRYSIEETKGGLWRVFPVAPGMPQHPKDVTLGDILRVRGYSLIAGDPIAGERITLGIQFVPLERLRHNFTTSLQLFDTNNEKVAQGNDHIPGDAEYPATKWRAGETIKDQFDIELPPLLTTGDYKIMLRVYDPSSGVEVGELTEIGEIRIEE